MNFRNPVNNVMLTKQLFYETTGSDKSSVVYTLKEAPHEGYPSLYQLYMSCNDPTEWKVSQTALGSWEHWEKLCESPWFQEYLIQWRRELEIKLKSIALEKIITLSKTGGKEQFQANRFLIEKGWVQKEEKVGRPSKERIRQAANDLFSEKNRTDNDYARISILRGN